MANDNFTQATAYLKQAVPLMIKYQIPTTPTNYALWYTYVAQTNPQLTDAVNKTIEDSGVCTPLSSELLYQQHVAAQTERNVDTMKQSLEAMVTENCQREQLTVLEEADAIQGMLDLGATTASVAHQLGRSSDAASTYAARLQG